MHVPIPVVIVLCLAVVAAVWWHGTAHYDFLTPPAGVQAPAGGQATAAPATLPATEPVLVKPAKPAPAAVILHAGTARRTAEFLTPLMQDVAAQIARAAGTLTVSVRVNGGADIPEDIGPPPVAIWLSGTAEDAPGTGVMSFTLDDPARARDEILHSVMKVIDGYLGTSAAAEPPAPGENPAEYLRRRISADAWRDLGTRLNHPPS